MMQIKFWYNMVYDDARIFNCVTYYSYGVYVSLTVNEYLLVFYKFLYAWRSFMLLQGVTMFPDVNFKIRVVVVFRQ